MNSGKIAFIGGGNMARAIIGGLLDSGVDIAQLAVAEPFDNTRNALAEEFPGLHTHADNNAAALGAETLVLAVKPQVLAAVCAELKATVQQARPLIISVAAGTRASDIDDWLGAGLSVVRVMPNQPAMIGMGVSGLSAYGATTEPEKKRATDIMSAVGSVVWVDGDDAIDAVTAISGSGPAYFFLFIDLLTRAGTDLGLKPDIASQLALETARGATCLAALQDSGESMQELIARVRSPGGTTAAALDAFDSADLHAIFSRAVKAARDRAVELADAAGGEA